jgi:RNA polymerase sigma-54 factor
MALEARLDIRLSQKLILTPQLQQAIKLLQMPQLELAAALNQELIENPFLEEVAEEKEGETGYEEAVESPPSNDDSEKPLETLMQFGSDDYFEDRGSDGRDLGYFNYDMEEQPSYEMFCSKKPDLYDHLLWQLRLSTADDDVRRAAEAVIGNIDDDGYLRESDEGMALSFNIDIETVKKAVSLVQGFDPPGIGARSLQECLLLQLDELNLRDTLVEKIVVNNMEDLQRKRYPVIAKQHNASLDDVNVAVKIIEGLDPRPGASFSGGETNYIVPDVFISKSDEGYAISLNDEGMPRLRLNNSYRKLLMRKDLLSKEELDFLRDKLKTASELMKSLDQRNKTIYKVADSLLKFQNDFFDYGIQHLKPLNLRDIAQDIGMHESTISRVTSNKYLASNHGVFGFRFFFSSAIQSEGGDMSSTSVKDVIKNVIMEEDPKKPLSDELIAKKLKGQNITIARRTVAKYREEMRIPSQSRRRKYE